MKNPLAPSMIAFCLSVFFLCAESAAKNKPLFKDYMGLNGHSIQFKPELYAPVANHLRDYHPYIWDVAGATSQPPEFPYSRERIDNGEPINWETMYQSWIDEGFVINTTLQFNWMKKKREHKNARFDDFPNDVEMYAREFAKFFGPSGARKLVQSVEIGNEVTHWSDAEYLKLFEAAARGIRAGDPNILILPATVSSLDEERIPQEKPIQLLEGHLDLFDVINIHTYSFLEHFPTWERTYPEDASTPYLKVITEMEKWRAEHAPEKPIWVTEFGYDSVSPEGAEKKRIQSMKRWKSSTDLEQAQWLIRSFLIFAEYDVQRAYMYWANDKDRPSLHGASGLTRNYEPKPSYFAMQQLYENLGDYRFSRIVEKVEGEIYAYEFLRGANQRERDQRIWAVWSPTQGNEPTTRQIKNVSSKPLAVEGFALERSGVSSIDDWSWQRNEQILEVEVGESPVYIFFDK